MAGKIIRPEDVIEPISQSELELQLQGWRLSTANILYYMPDHPALLQEFIWQTLDVAPRYPRIHQFLGYWRENIDAVIHSVRLASGENIAPAKVGHINALICH